MIRTANFEDTPAMISLLQAAHAKSHYAKSGLVDVDPEAARQLLMLAMLGHGKANEGAGWVQVAVNGTAITGLIVGTLARVYGIGTKLFASDLFWISLDGGHPRDAANLMRGFLRWAWESPHVIEVKCGTTSVIDDDPAQAGKILRRLGMTLYGQLYKQERPA